MPCTECIDIFFLRVPLSSFGSKGQGSKAGTLLNRNQFTKPTVQGILSLSSVRGNVICSEPCSGCMSIIMIVPPCRPLPRRLAAVSFLFVFSVDHPLCRLAIVAITSLPGFHQSEREGRLGGGPCPSLYVVGMRGEEGRLSVCRGRVSSKRWFKPEGNILLFTCGGAGL